MTLPLARLRPGPRPRPEPDPGLLSGTPWSVRLTGGLGTRPVVEIDELDDSRVRPLRRRLGQPSRDPRIAPPRQEQLMVTIPGTAA